MKKKEIHKTGTDIISVLGLTMKFFFLPKSVSLSERQYFIDAKMAEVSAWKKERVQKHLDAVWENFSADAVYQRPRMKSTADSRSVFPFSRGFCSLAAGVAEVCFETFSSLVWMVTCILCSAISTALL